MSNYVYSKNWIVGKCDYLQNGTNDCTAEISISFRQLDEGLELSLMGSIYRVHNNPYICGQCLEEIQKYFPNNEKLNRIVQIGKRYHLNGTHPGCVHQREFEKEPYEKHKDAHCNICNYTYGTSWIFETIPDEIIAELKTY